MADHAYLGLSPVISHDKSGRVLQILRASLTNRPNLRGLTALHQEDPMSLTQRLAKALGLDADTPEDALIDRVTSLRDEQTEADELPALQSQMSEIGIALGVEDGADAGTILAAAKAASPGGGDAVVALQAELATVTGALNALQSESARARAEAFVDGEIKRGRVGVKPLRDQYVAMHMEDTARVEKEIGALPVLGASAALAAPPKAAATIALHQTAGDLVGKARALQAQEAAKGNTIGWIDAVHKASEAK